MRYSYISAKIYPTPDQERKLIRFLDVSRWIYNRALEHRIKAWKRRKQAITSYQQQSLLTQWRSRMDWIRAVPAQIERDALRRVDRGMRSFFRRIKDGEKPGHPRFKGKNRWRSFEALQPGKYLRENFRVHVPGIGEMRYRGMREFRGEIRGVCVMRRSRGWYFKLIVRDDLHVDKIVPSSSVGVDVGLRSFATLSDGRKIENPRWFQSSQRRLRFLQRIVARRKKGSNRRRRAIERVARFQEKIADTRRGWIHKETRKLINQYDLIALENLSLGGMSRGLLSKSVRDAAWGIFIRQLEYKAESAGKTVVRINPRGTSQECSVCGLKIEKKMNERVHSCPCGCVLDRDHNAAINILRRATAKSTLAESTLAGDGAQSPSRRGSKMREVTPTQK